MYTDWTPNFSGVSKVNLQFKTFVSISGNDQIGTLSPVGTACLNSYIYIETAQWGSGLYNFRAASG